MDLYPGFRVIILVYCSVRFSNGRVFLYFTYLIHFSFYGFLNLPE